MAYYTFSCINCGKKFEVRCSVAEKDSGQVVCPGCGANELDRIFQGFTVAVKGSSGCDAGQGCPLKSSCGRDNCGS